MNAISNNLSFKDYLVQGHTTPIQRTAHNDNITDNHFTETEIKFPVVYDKRRKKAILTVPKKYFTVTSKKSVIYCIVRKSDGKTYIGKTTNLRRRMYKWNYDVNNKNSFRFN